MARPKKGTTPEQRFWERVNKTETCWLWTGHTRRDYGRFMTNGQKNLMVHRYSWEIHNGPIPEGLDVLHKCVGSRNCVNPDHLYLGTDLENVQDRINAGTKVGPEWKTDPCSKGHEYNEENFSHYWNANAKHGAQWKRQCLVCAREKIAKRRKEKED